MAVCEHFSDFRVLHFTNLRINFSSTKSFDVTSQEMRLIQVSDVHKTYKSKQGVTPVLNNFSMNVECGTMLVGNFDCEK